MEKNYDVVFDEVVKQQLEKARFVLRRKSTSAFNFSIFSSNALNSSFAIVIVSIIIKRQE